MGQLTFQATLGGAVNLAGPNTASTTTFTLPSADGSSGQVLLLFRRHTQAQEFQTLLVQHGEQVIQQLAAVLLLLWQQAHHLQHPYWEHPQAAH